MPKSVFCGFVGALLLVFAVAWITVPLVPYCLLIAELAWRATVGVCIVSCT
jgi:hypothetical protein